MRLILALLSPGRIFNHVQLFHARNVSLLSPSTQTYHQRKVHIHIPCNPRQSSSPPPNKTKRNQKPTNLSLHMGSTPLISSAISLNVASPQVYRCNSEGGSRPATSKSRLLNRVPTNTRSKNGVVTIRSALMFSSRRSSCQPNPRETGVFFSRLTDAVERRGAAQRASEARVLEVHRERRFVE